MSEVCAFRVPSRASRRRLLFPFVHAGCRRQDATRDWETPVAYLSLATTRKLFHWPSSQTWPLIRHRKLRTIQPSPFLRNVLRMSYQPTAVNRKPGRNPIMVFRPVSVYMQPNSLICSTGAVYELVITNGKGYGLFATYSIPRGTRVLEETPLITISPPSLPPKKNALPALDIEELTTALDGLSPEQHEACFELYHDPHAAVRAHKRIRKAQEHFKQATVSHKLTNAHKIESMVKLHAIYQTNVVRLGDDEKSGSGIFPLASRINHSCVPNLQIHYIPELGKLVAHAVRHINKGEELTINYSSKVCMYQRQRDGGFGRCSFRCACRACLGPQAAASQERREAMLDLEGNLAAFDRPDTYIPHIATPRTPQAALEVGEDLIELLRAEGIADQCLQKA